MRNGGLGGLGGFSPKRHGTPNSGWVQSDDEFNQSWMDKAPAQYIGGGGGGGGRVGPPPVDDSGRPMPLYGPNGSPVMGSSGAPTMYKPNIAQPNDRGGFMPTNEASRPIPMGKGPDGMPIMGNPVQSAPTETPGAQNPAWAEWNNNYMDAQQLRHENQMRQQQAYDGMINNGAENGLIPQFYSQPGFGQVSGQSNGFNGNGGTQVGGVDNSWTTGAYVPTVGMSGTYNPTPYGASNYAKDEWGL